MKVQEQVTRSGLPPYIVINIDKSTDARGVEKAEEIIQRDAMLDFFRHVSKSVGKARRYREFLMRGDLTDRPREHDTITISGGRGAGKTTFILSMFNLLHKPEQLRMIDTTQGIMPDDIESLGILDPTLIEEKEHVFIHLLAKIKQKVDRAYRFGVERRDSQKRRQDDCSRDADYYVDAVGPCDFRPISDECYRDWLKLLKCLSAGLPCLDGIGEEKTHNSDKWHDPVYVMETGLRNTTASNNLEVDFHHFVDKSLKLLNRTTFIIALDDIDTHFKRGWRVLEVLRKYLTTPQLITVLSGDLDLYSLLIRGQQWGNFEKALLDNEKERRSHFQHEVDKLEQQYLLKLLKSERRLELRSLYYLFEERLTSGKLAQDGITMQITSGMTDDSLANIDQILDDIIKQLFMVIGADQKLYHDHFTREVIRTVIRIITVYERSRRQLGHDGEGEVLNSLLDVLLDVYSVPLQQKGFNVHFLRDPDPRIALNQLVVGLADNGLLESGYRLKADFLDAEQNQLIMALGAVYNKLFKHNPRLFFDYFVKVGLTREIAILSESNEKKEMLNRYLTWSGLRSGDNGITISRQFTGFVRLQTAMLRTPTYRGTIALSRPRNKKSRSITGHIELIQKRFGITLTDDKPFQTFKTRLGENHPLKGFIAAVDSVQKESDYSKMDREFFFNSAEELETLITSWHWRLVNLGLERAIGTANDSMAYWSFHTLLAVIGEIAECTNLEQIKRSLLRSSQVRDFPLPQAASNTLDKVRFETMETTDSDDESDQSIPGEFIESLHDWNQSRKSALPVHVVAKIFARFFYSLGRVDGDLAASERYFGDIIHRHIVLFLNAVLVEEAIFKSIEVSLTNPTGGDKVIISKLKAISPYLGQLEFFSYLATCPLWGYFIDLNSPLTPLLKEIFLNRYCDDKVTYLDEIHFDNLHDLLNASFVRNVKDEESDEAEPARSSILVDRTIKKTRYNEKELMKLLKREGVDVRAALEPFVSDPVMMTNKFIDQYLKSGYSHIQSRSFDLIKRKLLKLMAVR